VKTGAKHLLVNIDKPEVFKLLYITHLIQLHKGFVSKMISEQIIYVDQDKKLNKWLYLQ